MALVLSVQLLVKCAVKISLIAEEKAVTYITMRKEMKSTCQVLCDAGLALDPERSLANGIELMHWDQLIIQP